MSCGCTVEYGRSPKGAIVGGIFDGHRDCDGWLFKPNIYQKALLENLKPRLAFTGMSRGGGKTLWGRTLNVPKR
jgi:hypothetical protein